MKFKILLTALMVTMISLTMSNDAAARPWHYRGGGGWHHPRVSVFVPPVPIPAPRVVVGPGYYGGGYYNQGYCAPRYRGSYYNGSYGNRYYNRGGGYYGSHRNYAYNNNYGYNGGYRHYGPRGQHYRR